MTEDALGETGKHKMTSSDKVEEYPTQDTMMMMIQNVSYATHCSQKLQQNNDFYDMVLSQNEAYHCSPQTHYDYITQ